MSKHRTVLLKETIEGLNLGKQSIVVDGTFGSGGHSREICRTVPGVTIIAIDQDKNTFVKAKKDFNDDFRQCKIIFSNENFRNIEKVLAEVGIKEVDGIILDLGLSSDQLESSGRGFSFLRDEPLQMTMKADPTPSDLTAYDVVNTWEEKNLADIIFGYGEEKQARRIAKAIVDSRKQKKIETTFELVEAIREAIPARFRKGKIHFATKTFQAIRIAVNDELGALSEALNGGWKSLKPGGRMSIISFHSLEDRMIKRFYKAMEELGEGKIINKKVILASDEEIKSNPRSRSAKLRIIEKKKFNS